MAKILIVVVLIIALIAPLFITGPDGEPIMTLDDWKFELPSSPSDFLPTEIEPEATISTPTEVYKWQDENGQWHFSNTPPEPDKAELMELSETNIMDAFEVPEPEPAAAATGSVEMPTGAMTASPDQVKQMMETVTNLQETIDNRKAEMDAIALPEG